MHQKSNLQDCFFKGKIYKVTQSCLTLKKRISYSFHICFIFLLQTLYNHSINILQLKFEGFSNIHVSHKLYEYDLVKITLKFNLQKIYKYKMLSCRRGRRSRTGKEGEREQALKGKYQFSTEIGKQEQGRGWGEERGRDFGYLLGSNKKCVSSHLLMRYISYKFNIKKK